MPAAMEFSWSWDGVAVKALLGFPSNIGVVASCLGGRSSDYGRFPRTDASPFP
jgi:hypothetical protein